MFENLFQLNKIGKELGLSRKDINKVLLFNNSKHSLLYTSLLRIVFIFFGVLIITLIIILGIEASRNTYAAGTYYSTVKIKDYKKNKYFKFK